MTIEEQKILDEENALKWKLRKEQIKQDKAKSIDAYKKKLLEPNIIDNLITWSDKHKNGNVYEGKLGDVECFEITRRVLTFSMKIIHKEIKVKKTNYSSTELAKLQKQANDILWQNKEFILKFKPVS